MSSELTHFDDQGAGRIVDVSEKAVTARMARASARVRMAPDTLRSIRSRDLAKGDVLQVARLAGIMAVKRTSELIPLCHALSIEAVSLEFTFIDEATLAIESTVRVTAKTGVEMEALTSVSVAALTVYDMCKAIDRGMTIERGAWRKKQGAGAVISCGGNREVSQTASEVSRTSSLLGRLYAPVEVELAQVEEVLRRELRSHYPCVDELVRYGCLLGGKRLRPVLLLLSGRAFGTLTREHVTLAAVVEMIHTASLVHDDVLDEAQTRRHLATVNSRWDTKTSVLLGDYLFTHAFCLASALGSTLACRTLGRATNLVVEGELRQKAAQGDYALTESEYLDIIAAKTAELCACSCALGAHLSGASQACADRFASFGRNLGIAFQIVDDVLDLCGDERTVGKSLGTDLQQRKATLPVIRLLQVATPTDRVRVLSVLNGESLERDAELAEFFRRYDAIAYAHDAARGFARQAAESITDLPSSETRRTLFGLTEFVVSRSR